MQLSKPLWFGMVVATCYLVMKPLAPIGHILFADLVFGTPLAA